MIIAKIDREYRRNWTADREYCQNWTPDREYYQNWIPDLPTLGNRESNRDRSGPMGSIAQIGIPDSGEREWWNLTDRIRRKSAKNANSRNFAVQSFARKRLLVSRVSSEPFIQKAISCLHRRHQC